MTEPVKPALRMDLHVHTSFSDGSLEPQQVVKLAAEAGLFAVALTDHDECRGPGEVKDDCGICVIPGIEIGARLSGDVHILGLGLNWRNEALIGYVEKAANSRRVRAYAMIDRLVRGGIDIKMADVEEKCGDGMIGRPHMAAALMEKGYVKTVKEAFDKYLSVKTPYYVPQQRVSIAQAVALIRQAGGLPVLAHPGLLGERAWRSLKPRLDGLGFWGIEAYHPSHTDGQCKEYESAARQSKLFITSGSDYHGSFTPFGIGQETRGGSFLQESFAAVAETICNKKI